MYHSNTNGNTTTTNPISYTLDQTTPYTNKPSFYENNPNSKQDQIPPPSSFFHSHSPYIHYYDDDDLVYLDLFLQQHQPPTAEAFAPAGSTKSIEIDRGKKFMKRSSSKKDRHSKIETARGPRDRRMRLSLDVARKFFNLQDMLGFDKASKTIEWLLTRSKTAIDEVKRGLPQHMKNSCSVGANNYSANSSTSECEVVSGNDDESTAVGGRKGKPSKSSRIEKKSTRAISRKNAFDPLARESRNQARARARERTREKKRFDESKLPSDAMDRDMNRLGCWSPFENGEESGTHHHHHLDHVLADHVEELSSSMIFNHSNGISQENQFSEFQVYGKPWEAYNNFNLF